MSDFIFIEEGPTDSVYALQPLIGRRGLWFPVGLGADHFSVLVHFLHDGHHPPGGGGGGGGGAAAVGTQDREVN